MLDCVVKILNSVSKKDIELLYGEALCNIQLLEDALSHAITLKKDVKYINRISKEEANLLLKKNRSLTFGKAVKITKKEMLYSDVLQNDLEVFLVERNWLVHKSLWQFLDQIFISFIEVNNFINRIRNIIKTSKLLQFDLETDLIKFSESKGLDMSKIKEIVAVENTNNLSNG